MTVSPERAKDEAEYIEIEFAKGEPVAINGERLAPVGLLEKLNEIGGQHGIGRVDLVENRFVGMKSRGVYETPGVTILHAAHRALESITMDREVMHLRDSLGVKFAENVYYGFWFAPEFELMRKMIDETQQNVSGEVRLKLFRGNVIVVGRRSPIHFMTSASPRSKLTASTTNEMPKASSAQRIALEIGRWSLGDSVGLCVSV
jgi:argininosuccinate synthase